MLSSDADNRVEPRRLSKRQYHRRHLYGLWPRTESDNNISQGDPSASKSIRRSHRTSNLHPRSLDQCTQEHHSKEDIRPGIAPPETSRLLIYSVRPLKPEHLQARRSPPDLPRYDIKRASDAHHK